MTPEDRFWSHVDRSDGCWIWTAAKRTGYGIMWWRDKHGRLSLAHRISFEMRNGPIPDGLLVDHMCHVRACVNPDHLRLATKKQNGENRSGPDRDSKSGVLGVYPYKGKWVAQVRHNGQNYRGGTFVNLADAERAVIALRNKLFTHNQDREES